MKNQQQCKPRGNKTIECLFCLKFHKPIQKIDFKPLLNKVEMKEAKYYDFNYIHVMFRHSIVSTIPCQLTHKINSLKI